MSSDDRSVLRLKDPKFYLENLCQIKVKRGGLEPFILNNAQRDLFNTLKRASRIACLKARQIGFSTAITGYLYHKAITTKGINVALIGYNSDLTRELLDKVKTFFRTTPDSLKPKIQYNSKFEVSFPNQESKILVLPSSENVGRGYTLMAALGTEIAFWDKAEEKLTALESAIPSGVGQLILETTPNGIGNAFHRIWMNENNDYVKKQYGWWWHYTEEEIDVIRRRMDPRRFAQEYELTFLTAGRSVFSAESIERQKAGVWNVGDEVDVGGGTKETVTKREDGLVIYKKPQPGGFYVAGVDTSEGITGGDYSGVVIWDRKTGEEVASFRDYVAPDKLAVLLNKWGRFYSNAFMVVEVNNHGLTVLTMLKNLLYPNIYFRPAKFDSLSSQTGDRMGWKTTKVTRDILIDDFVEAVREGSLTIHSKALVDEMTTFIYDNGNNPIAAEGYHDDLIFAAAIGLQGFKAMYDKPLTQINAYQYLPQSFSY